MRRSPTSARQTRRGTSLLETVAATIVTVMVIVPSAKIMRGSIDLSHRLHTRQEMAMRCSSLLEQQLAEQSVAFRNRKTNGTLDHNGARLGYQTECSDRTLFGGRPGRLMGIEVAVWHDLNRNRRRDPDEPHLSMYSTTVSAAVLASVAAR